jgi:hypothetical protein
MLISFAGYVLAQQTGISDTYGQEYFKIHNDELGRLQTLKRLEELARIKELLEKLGIVGDVGLVQDERGGYKLVSVNNNADGQPITIYVPDNRQVIIRKESERPK